MSVPPEPCTFEKCLENFEKVVPPAERFTAFNSAYQLMCPLPKQLEPGAGQSRDEQFYLVRICPYWNNRYTRDALKKAKDNAFEEMQAAEIAAAEGRAARFARAARDKAEDIADDLKERATAKARAITAGVKTKSARAARDLKKKAEEGVKEGAKGLFWKALGY
jgi:hypothetical protein